MGLFENIMQICTELTQSLSREKDRGVKVDITGYNASQKQKRSPGESDTVVEQPTPVKPKPAPEPPATASGLVRTHAPTETSATYSYVNKSKVQKSPESTSPRPAPKVVQPKSVSSAPQATPPSKVEANVAYSFTQPKPGEEFEQSCYEALSTLAELYQGRLFRKVVLPSPSGKAVTTEIDLIVVLPTCVLVVECKDWGGEIHANYAKDQNWYQVLHTGEVCEYYNPVRQNDLHVRALAAKFSVPNENLVSCILFSKRARLHELPKQRPYMWVGHASQFPNVLPKIIGAHHIATPDFSRLCIGLLECQRQQSVSSEPKQGHFTKVVTKADLSVCPKCGGMLVRRVRREDGHPFFGCAAYPKCKYTCDIE